MLSIYIHHINIGIPATACFGLHSNFDGRDPYWSCHVVLTKAVYCDPQVFKKAIKKRV